MQQPKRAKFVISVKRNLQLTVIILNITNSNKTDAKATLKINHSLFVYTHHPQSQIHWNFNSIRMYVIAKAVDLWSDTMPLNLRLPNVPYFRKYSRKEALALWSCGIVYKYVPLGHKAHSSVREYLQKARNVWKPQVRAQCRTICSNLHQQGIVVLLSGLEFTSQWVCKQFEHITFEANEGECMDPPSFNYYYMQYNCKTAVLLQWDKI